MANKAPLSYLLDLLGVRFVKWAGVAIAQSRTLNFLGTAVTAAYNASTGDIDVDISASDIDFKNTDSGGGNATMTVPPNKALPITTLLTATNANFDFDTEVNGIFRFSVSATVKKITAGTYATSEYVVTGSRVSSVLTLEGTPVEEDLGGDSTGLTLAITASGSSLRVNIANSTGETVNGYVHCGWAKSDLVE